MNPIEIPVSELKAALPGLRQIIGRRTNPLAILNCVRIQRQLSGRLTLQASDRDSTATYHSLTEPGQPEVILHVLADELAEVLKSAAKDDQIQFVSDGETTRLRHRVGGHWLERPLAQTDSAEWPVTARLDTEPVALPPELPATLKTSFDFMANDNRQSLHGAWLDVESAAGHYVMASNGHALFTANSFTFGLKESLLVPYHGFLAWEGFQQDGPWTLRLKAKRGKHSAVLQLGSEHWTYVRLLPEAQQPSWRQVVPTQSLTQVRFSEAGAQSLLELLRHLPSSVAHQHRCDLSFSPERSTVTGRERERSQTAELFGLTVVGKAQTVSLNRNYMIQALKLGLRELELTDDLSPVRFHAGGRQVVVMPLRPDIDPVPTPGPTAEAPAPPPEPETQPAATSSAPPAAASSPQPNPEPQTTTPTPAPMSKETQANPEASTETVSALRQAIAKVEGLKDGLKAMLTDLNDVLKVLNVAQKEQRASEREVEEVRAALEAVKKLRL
jgi:hypothetical protein